MTNKLNKKNADAETKKNFKWLGTAISIYEYGKHTIVEYVRKDEGTIAFKTDGFSYDTITEAIIHCELGENYRAVSAVCKMFNN